MYSKYLIIEINFALKDKRKHQETVTEQWS